MDSRLPQHNNRAPTTRLRIEARPWTPDQKWWAIYDTVEQHRSWARVVAQTAPREVAPEREKVVDDLLQQQSCDGFVNLPRPTAREVANQGENARTNEGAVGKEPSASVVEDESEKKRLERKKRRERIQRLRTRWAELSRSQENQVLRNNEQETKPQKQEQERIQSSPPKQPAELEQTRKVQHAESASIQVAQLQHSDGDETMKKAVEEGDLSRLLQWYNSCKSRGLDERKLEILLNSIDTRAEEAGGWMIRQCTLNGNSEMLRMLLDWGLHISRKSNVLHFASRMGKPDVVQVLLGYVSDGTRLRLKLSVNDRDRKGQTALHVACCVANNSDVVRILVDAGSSVGIRDKKGNAPLHLAAEHGHEPLVKTLLMEGSKESRNHLGRTALHCAAVNGHDEVVAKLILHGWSMDTLDNDMNTPLLLATYSGWESTTRLLVERGASLLPCVEEGYTGLYLMRSDVLHVAARQGRTRMVKLLLELSRLHRNLLSLDVNMENPIYPNDTPLIEAVSNANWDTVRYLLDQGADVGKRNKEHQSAFLLCVRQTKMEIPRDILKAIVVKGQIGEAICALFESLAMEADNVNGHSISVAEQLIELSDSKSDFHPQMYALLKRIVESVMRHIGSQTNVENPSANKSLKMRRKLWCFTNETPLDEYEQQPTFDPNSGSDMTIVVRDGSKIFAHKAMLISRCSVFRGLLSHQWGGNASSVDLTFYEGWIIQALIEFLYTETFADAEKVQWAPESYWKSLVNVSTHIERMIEIILVADEFLLPRMVRLCESSIAVAVEFHLISKTSKTSPGLHRQDLKNLIQIVDQVHFSAGLLREFCVNALKPLPTDSTMPEAHRKHWHPALCICARPWLSANHVEYCFNLRKNMANVFASKGLSGDRVFTLCRQKGLDPLLPTTTPHEYEGATPEDYKARIYQAVYEEIHNEFVLDDPILPPRHYLHKQLDNFVKSGGGFEDLTVLVVDENNDTIELRAHSFALIARSLWFQCHVKRGEKILDLTSISTEGSIIPKGATSKMIVHAESWSLVFRFCFSGVLDLPNSSQTLLELIMCCGFLDIPGMDVALEMVIRENFQIVQAMQSTRSAEGENILGLSKRAPRFHSIESTYLISLIDRISQDDRATPPFQGNVETHWIIALLRHLASSLNSTGGTGIRSHCVA